MNEKTSQKIQIWAAWCGPAFVVLYGLTWVIMGHNYPPPNPSWSAQELVDNYYLKYQSSILLGQSLATAFGILYGVWAVQVTIQMWRREPVPLLSLIQMCGGLLTTWVLMFVPVLWAWCAENSSVLPAQTIKNVHVIGWYIFDMTYWITTIEVIAIFVLVMKDKTKPGLVPKWVAAIALFSGLSFLPLTFLPYFKTGPLAYNGYWSFHVAFVSYGLFTFLFGPYMVKDIKRVRVVATPGVAQAISRKQGGQ